jgi:hypothetical protein
VHVLLHAIELVCNSDIVLHLLSLCCCLTHESMWGTNVVVVWFSAPLLVWGSCSLPPCTAEFPPQWVGPFRVSGQTEAPDFVLDLIRAWKQWFYSCSIASRFLLVLLFWYVALLLCLMNRLALLRIVELYSWNLTSAPNKPQIRNLCVFYGRECM